MVPTDLVLSFFAKRSYAAYRLWHEYNNATVALFDQPQEAAEADRSMVSQLHDNGCAIVPGPYAADGLAEARRWVLGLYERAKRSPQFLASAPTDEVTWDEGGVHFEALRADGRFRFHFPADFTERTDIPEVLRQFPRTRSLRAALRSYFAASEVLDGLPYYVAEVMEPACRLESWHIDCLRPTVKCYLVLDDIGDEQAPLRYVPGSHRTDDAKHRLFFQIANSGLGNAYFDESTCKQLDTTGRSLTAPAGSLILFDTRGMHAGSLCRSGHRIVLAIGFRPMSAVRINPRVLKDPSVAKYPWDRGPGARDTRYPLAA